MSEYLDYYDKNGSYLGKETRDAVHAKGLWHKTVHCWIYDKSGNVYFQLRAENGKMYTSASGHVNAGETLNQAFAREVKEEIGIDVELENSKLVEVVVWKMDKVKSNGTIFKDRAFANVYVNEIESISNFYFDPSEVCGLIKIKAKDALRILNKEIVSTNATKINAKNETESKSTTIDDFLIFPHEIGVIKYGRVLQFIIAETES